MDGTRSAAKKARSPEPKLALDAPRSPLRPAQEETVFEYWAGNPSVEIVHGHVQVARTCEQPTGQKPGTKAEPSGDGFGSVASCMALASSVPCHMSAPEFCDFIGAFGAETHRRFRHCRVLHGRHTEEYLIAVLMVSPEDTAALVQQYHGQRYNAIEAGECSIYPVLNCQRGPPVTEDAPSSPLLPRLRSPGPKMAHPSPQHAGPAGTELSQGSGQQVQPSPFMLPTAPPAMAEKALQALSPAASPGLPEASLPELFVDTGVGPQGVLSPGPAGSDKPFCAVCLETVESNPAEYQLTELGGGVPLTILCGHTFHARCLSRWCDASCPVCRFQQHPYQTSSCDVCGQAEGVHICLVCGFIGCTVDQGEGHAKQHFEATSHAYALEVNTQHVWDYAGNGYVHRLLYNDQDGKMVEHTVPPNPWAGTGHSSGSSATAAAEAGPEGPSPRTVAFGTLRWADMEDDDCEKVAALFMRQSEASSSSAAGAKKQEAVVSEFNELLSSQMTAQRHHFDELRQELEQRNNAELQELEEQHAAAAAAADEVQRQLDNLKSDALALEKSIADTSAADALAQRQRQQLETLSARISGEQRAFEDRQGDQEERKKAARQHRDCQVAELKQEIKDLELFLQMRRRCEASADAADLQSSHLLVTESSGRRGARKPRRR